MKHILALITCILIGYTAFATHSLGGYISYEHLNGNTFEISVVLFQDATSPAISRREIEINWGDNNSDTLLLDNEESLGQVGNFNLRKRVFKGIHTYQGSSTYTISVEDPNRIPNIVNIENSVNTPLRIETTLDINPSIAVNNSVSINSRLVVIGELNNGIKFNPAALDTDGDALSYQLVSTKGIAGGVAPSYQIPSGVSINEENGEITWDTPNIPGLYQFTIRVTECRDGTSVSHSEVDFLVSLSSSNSSNAIFLGSFLADTNQRGSIFYQLFPGDSLELNLDPNFLFDSLQLIDGTNLASINGANQFKLSYQNNSSRCEPYLFVVNGMKNGVDRHLSLLINIIDSTTLATCDSSCNLSAIGIPEIANSKIITSIAPNPFKESALLRIESDLTIPHSNSELTIYNTSGTAVKRSTMINNKVLLERGNLSNGIYFYSISFENKIIGHGKFILY